MEPQAAASMCGGSHRVAAATLSPSMRPGLITLFSVSIRGLSRAVIVAAIQDRSAATRPMPLAVEAEDRQPVGAQRAAAHKGAPEKWSFPQLGLTSGHRAPLLSAAHALHVVNSQLACMHGYKLATGAAAACGCCCACSTSPLALNQGPPCCTQARMRWCAMANGGGTKNPKALVAGLLLLLSGFR